MHNWSIFKSFLRISFQDHLTYKNALLIYMFDVFFLPLISLFVWRVVASSSPQLNSQIDSITNYYLLLPLVALYTSAWHGTYLANDIRAGRISSALSKPFSLFTQFFAGNCSSKFVKTFFLLPMVIFSLFLFNLKLTPTLLQISTFIISLGVTAILAFYRDHLIGLLAFWLDDISAINDFFDISEFTFGGRVVPIFIFPPLLKSIAFILPFRYFTVFPLEIITGTLSPTQIFTGLSIQLVWLCLAVYATSMFWKKGVRRYSAFGG